jgi:hypothetical protein
LGSWQLWRALFGAAEDFAVPLALVQSRIEEQEKLRGKLSELTGRETAALEELQRARKEDDTRKLAEIRQAREKQRAEREEIGRQLQEVTAKLWAEVDEARSAERRYLLGQSAVSLVAALGLLALAYNPFRRPVQKHAETA